MSHVAALSSRYRSNEPCTRQLHRWARVTAVADVGCSPLALLKPIGLAAGAFLFARLRLFLFFAPIDLAALTSPELASRYQLCAFEHRHPSVWLIRQTGLPVMRRTYVGRVFVPRLDRLVADWPDAPHCPPKHPWARPLLSLFLSHHRCLSQGAILPEGSGVRVLLTLVLMLRSDVALQPSTEPIWSCWAGHSFRVLQAQ